jgi:predicted ATP-grasp superfamily ATP-dependent carboligase
MHDLERGSLTTPPVGRATVPRQVPRNAARPPVLLTNADYYGTLAAVRSLGRAGIEVVVAEWRHLVPARWSRFTSRVLSCPDAERHPERYVDWLAARAARSPGHVLLPTNDDLAWLLASRREELGAFHLDLPPLRTIDQVLNKWLLREACRGAGIATPETWLPEDGRALERVAREARFPVMLKPQTQALLWPRHKGLVARDRSELRVRYEEFRARTRYAAPILRHDPGIARPMVQEFAIGQAERIYGLSGFIDATGELFVVAASRKLLQRPRTMGVGLCFEAAELELDLAARLARLCRAVGYHGMFETEFLDLPGGHQLIDFNPRLFNQTGFDVARGLDLPLLSYLAAVRDRTALRDEVSRASAASRTGERRVFCSGVELRLFLHLSQLAPTASDGAQWRRWLERNRACCVDATHDAEDWRPGVVEVATAMLRVARHPRWALRAARAA